MDVCLSNQTLSPKSVRISAVVRDRAASACHCSSADTVSRPSLGSSIASTQQPLRQSGATTCARPRACCSTGQQCCSSFSLGRDWDSSRSREQAQRATPSLEDPTACLRKAPSRAAARTGSGRRRPAAARTGSGRRRPPGNEQSTVTGTTTQYRSPIRSSTSTTKTHSRRHP
jgi:hypothetical protein